MRHSATIVIVGREDIDSYWLVQSDTKKGLESGIRKRIKRWAKQELLHEPIIYDTLDWDEILDGEIFVFHVDAFYNEFLQVLYHNPRN